MTDGYLICYETDDSEYARFKTVGGFNEISAISNFYNELSWAESHVDIDDEMFYKLINNLSVEEAVRVHNAFVPDFHIIFIYGVSKAIYCEGPYYGANGEVKEK